MCHTAARNLLRLIRQKFDPTGKVGGYAGNVHLANATVADVVSQLRNTGQLHKSYIIISADHGTKSTDKNYRVPFIVKTPGKNDGYLYKKEINTVVTGDMILGILDGKIVDGRSIGDWLTTNSRIGVSPVSAIFEENKD